MLVFTCGSVAVATACECQKARIPLPHVQTQQDAACQRIQDTGPTHPQQLLFTLLLHEHLLQLLVEPFQAPVQAGTESQDRGP